MTAAEQSDRPPVPLRFPAPERLDVTYNCPRCGDDVDYESGSFDCVPCGMTWGEDANSDGEIDTGWSHFLHELSQERDNWAASGNVHLMIYTEPSPAWPSSDHTWFAHFGCATKAWSRKTLDCEFAEAIGDGHDAFTRGGMELSGGVPYRLGRGFAGREVAVLASGVYRVELSGLALVPLKVVELIARIDDPLEPFTADNLERHHPDMTPDVAMRYHRPMITVNLPD